MLLETTLKRLKQIDVDVMVVGTDVYQGSAEEIDIVTLTLLVNKSQESQDTLNS